MGPALSGQIRWIATCSFAQFRVFASGNAYAKLCSALRPHQVDHNLFTHAFFFSLCRDRMLAFIINNRPLKRLSDAPNGLQGSRHSFHFSSRVFYGFKGAQGRRPWKTNPFMPSYMTSEIDIPYINPQPSPLASSSNHNNPPPSSLRSSLGPWSSLRA